MNMNSERQGAQANVMDTWQETCLPSLAAPGRSVGPARLLGEADVHVWRACLDRPPASADGFRAVLSPDEVARAQRFHFEHDRLRFVVARGTLRALLGWYLGVPPSAVRFGYTARGKPFLLPDGAMCDLRFNISHAGPLALYAVARGRELGVDLEQARPLPEMEQLARHVFSAREQAELAALPAGARLHAFYTCWTRKEAYVKARGEGLSLPLHSFDVSLSPRAPAALLDVRGDPTERRRWSLRELPMGAGYVATLAIEGHGWRLACWDASRSG